MGAYDLGELGPAQVASSGLQGLLEAYKMKMSADVEQAKMRQSGFNAGAGSDMDSLRLAETIRANLAREKLKGEEQDREGGARIETLNGRNYLVRKGARGQEIWTAESGQIGSAPQATEAQGNIASISQAPEYLAALNEVPGGQVGRRASQTPVIGSLLGLISPKIAAAREKRKAFITPYLSSGGGKALTEGEKKVFEGRVSESSFFGPSTAEQGIKDLTKEIAGKPGSASGTLAMGPETGNLQAALDAAMAKARAGGALPGGPEKGGAWEATIYRGKPARRRRTPEGAWEVEVQD